MNRHSKLQPRQLAPNSDIRSKEIRVQLQTLKRAEEMIYPKTIYCTSENQEHQFLISAKSKRRAGAKQYSSYINENVFIASSIDHDGHMFKTHSIPNQSLSLSPTGGQHNEKLKLVEKLNACQDIQSEVHNSQEKKMQI
jgi:hypothetical protein